MRIRVIRILASLALLALFTTSGLAQDEPRRKELPNFHKVNEKLYRGAQPKEGGLKVLREMGIRTIVNLRDDDSRAEEARADAIKAGFRYYNIPLGRWGRPQDKEIEQALSAIQNPEHQPVFVHCAHGADRTGVVVAVYRMTHDGWTSEQAKAEAKRYGLKPWQFGMKDYISDFYKRLRKQNNPPNN
ncbi:MAG: fused DSP-PTPase phosphatase/NAD kinase-like protein [Pyrinomonadaceae bacterium]